jgi:peptide/nickel transport system permease protein
LIPYIVKRLIAAVPLLLLLTVLEFGLLRILPGDPVEVLLGSSEKDLSQQELAVVRHDLGLDRSLPEQYIAWLKEVLKGNLGRSYRDGRPVSVLIRERLPATIALVGSALTVSIILGTFWGALMVWLGSSRLGRLLDRFSASLALVLYCLPSFWLAFLLIAWVALTRNAEIQLLGLHPPGQSGIWFASLILPASILASRRTAKLALLLRASMNEEMEKEYVRTAMAKGLSRIGVLVRHVAKNSLGPVIAFLGLSIPALIGGSVLVEIVFAWPGMGRLAVDATFGRNYPVLLGLTLVYGALVIASNLIADIVHRLVDPRIASQDDSQGPVNLGQTRT